MNINVEVILSRPSEKVILVIQVILIKSNQRTGEFAQLQAMEWPNGILPRKIPENAAMVKI